MSPVPRGLRWRIARVGSSLCVLLGCGGDGATALPGPQRAGTTTDAGGAGAGGTAPGAAEGGAAGVSGGAAAGAHAGGTGGMGDASVGDADGRDAGAGDAGAGGAGAGGAGAGGAGAGDAGAGEPEVRVDSGAPIRVNVAPSSLEVFALPINSARYAAAGYDPAARVCVSIIWDFSNNELAPERHCDDFLTYFQFPYVLVTADRDEPCPALWGYVGSTPTAATGCIDPLAGLVNAQVAVEAEGARYDIRIVNDPSL